MNDEIKCYYDELASNYDANRFSNSYGKFIDSQERAFLEKNLPEISTSKILDLGCGTGRFLNFANFGVDISPKMIEVAKEKYPEKSIKLGLKIAKRTFFDSKLISKNRFAKKNESKIDF